MDDCQPDDEILPVQEVPEVPEHEAEGDYVFHALPTEFKELPKSLNEEEDGPKVRADQKLQDFTKGQSEDVASSP